MTDGLDAQKMPSLMKMSVVHILVVGACDRRRKQQVKWAYVSGQYNQS